MQQTVLDGTTSDSVLTAPDQILTVSQARALVDLFARVTTSRNADDFIKGFTEDCVITFNRAEVHGKAALHAFMAERFAKMPETYVCEKRLRALNGNVLGVEWHNYATDPETKVRKVIGHGCEFWVMRGEQIARWDAAFGV
jgi:nuclear transport factor 2 (NTF2) superfamily protein